MSSQTRQMLMLQRTTLLSCLASSALAAQPVITAADAPAPGNSWAVIELSNLPPLAAGTNATWNLSSATITGTRQLQLTQPSGAPGASNFPNATVVANADGESPYNFLQATGSELRTLGVVNTAPNIYSDPLITMVFPCSLGTSWTDTYANVLEQGTRSYTADAYGTLIGPSGTLTNVLRVHTEYFTLDTVVSGTPYQAIMIEDAFWRSGMCWPVATSFWFRVFAAGIMVQEQRVGSALVVMSSFPEDVTGVAGIRAWPNPARDQIQVQVAQGGWYGVMWSDALGRTIVRERHHFQTDEHCVVNVPFVPNGLLFLKLTSDSGMDTSLPVVVQR
jgi:hypothetical protein